MGRPTDAIRHRFERMLEESNAYSRFKKILIQTKDNPTFLKAFEFGCDRAFGKALQSADLRIEDITDNLTREELLELKQAALANRQKAELDRKE